MLLFSQDMQVQNLWYFISRNSSLVCIHQFCFNLCHVISVVIKVIAKDYKVFYKESQVCPLYLLRDPMMQGIIILIASQSFLTTVQLVFLLFYFTRNILCQSYLRNQVVFLSHSLANLVSSFHVYKKIINWSFCD